MITFNLKKEWFEKIKSGEKTHEYREVKLYWQKRINNYLDSFNGDYDYTTGKLVINDDVLVKFVLGYTKEFIIAKVIGITIISGSNTDLKVDTAVYDIEFELLKD